MNLLQRIWGRLTEFFTTQSDVLSQQLRIVTRRIRSSFQSPTHDWARADYVYWRSAYFCRVRGLEISGLFLKPLVNKIAGWAIGQTPAWRTDDKRTTEALTDWWNEHLGDVVDGYRGALKEGDAIAIINSDLSVTYPPPETVDPIVAEDDYSRVIGWRITQVFAHPTNYDRMTMIDEYFADRRVQRVEVNGVTRRERTYRNLIGRLPVVLIANRPQEGETFGHPEAEALVEILQRYGEIFEAAVEGNRYQGRPTPLASFATVADMDAFWNLYGKTRKQTLPDGTVEDNPYLDVDLDQILTMSGATFDYKSPAPFIQETERLLGLMFYLILEHTEIPEFVFGNAIASSKASADAQMPVFERFIELRRMECARWMIEMAEIVLAYLQLVEPGVQAVTPTLQWRKLTQDGQLTLDTIRWAFTEGLLDERTAVLLAPVDVQDVDDVLEKARAERAAATPTIADDAAQMDRQLQDEINALEI